MSRLLLTSLGINNNSIYQALVGLLRKPLAEANAIFIPTGIHSLPGSPYLAHLAISGKAQAPLCELGWKSLGVLELTALPSIDREMWLPSIMEADALLVWGGDPLYLSYWMHHSGMKDLLPSLLGQSVYVGVSAGSMVASSIFGETYHNPPRNSDGWLTSQYIVFNTPTANISRTLITAEGMGLVDFALIPHMDHKDHPDASMANAAKWAAKLCSPVYAIDDQTAIKVDCGVVEVVSEGNWKLFGS